MTVVDGTMLLEEVCELDNVGKYNALSGVTERRFFSIF